MTLSFKRLGLSILALCGCLATADASTVIKISDSFPSNTQNTLWTKNLGITPNFICQNDHLCLRRKNSHLNATQVDQWSSTFSGKQNAWIYDVCLTVHVPHKIIAPEGDNTDLCEVGVGFSINDPNHYVQLAMTDTLASRLLILRTYNGKQAFAVCWPLPAEVNKTVILRLTLINGQVKTMWRTPGGIFRKIGDTINISALVSTAPSATVLRPYLTGLIQNAACPIDWNVWADDFSLIYQHTP